MFGTEAEVNEVKNPPPTWLLPASVIRPTGQGMYVRLDAARPTALFLFMAASFSLILCGGGCQRL